MSENATNRTPESDPAHELRKYFTIWTHVLGKCLQWSESMVACWADPLLNAPLPELTLHEAPMHWISGILIPWDLRLSLSLAEVGQLQFTIERALDQGDPLRDPATDEEYSAVCERVRSVLSVYRSI